MSQPHARQIAAVILFPALLTVPITTAYSVRVHRALDVRLVIRRAMQYILARYTLAAVAALPFVVFVAYVYAQRERRIEDLLQGSAAIGALFLSLLGLLILRARRPALEALDRRFFREQHDAHRVLSDLAESMRGAETPRQIAERLAVEIDRALHLEAVAVMLVDPAGRLAVAHGHARGLPADSVLGGRVFEHADPVEIDWAHPGPHLRGLPTEDRDWLVDGAFRLLVPMASSNARPLGLIGLSDKRSELPFSGEDRMLLKSIALSVGLVLETRSARSEQGGMRSPQPEWAGSIGPEATECAKCGVLEPAPRTVCSRCGGDMVASPVPILLADKFRLERRVGAGGMGVVYRARDLSLHRTVAVKTLPRPEPHEAASLRREARAMAKVSHPNLALIFGVESWRGVPILILEYMEGGTLASILPARRYEVHEAVELGIVLCGALAHLHTNGIVHRDIKPSNLGFTDVGVPKILDFGIARMMGAARTDRASRLSALPYSLRTSDPTRSGRAFGDSSIPDEDAGAGTLIYMSPEALAGEPVHPSFDVWSLTLVIYEAVAGGHPFAAARVHWGQIPRVPDLRESWPACPVSVAAFFERALSIERARRPSSASDLRRRLEELRTSPGGPG
jgi:GAF domain-containing protein